MSLNLKVFLLFVLGMCSAALFGMSACELAHGASSQSIERHNICVRHAAFATSLYDLIISNPAVILNAEDEAYQKKFEAVRQWIEDGKPRSGLSENVYNHCIGEEA